jgi:hypothetical protein
MGGLPFVRIDELMNGATSVAAIILKPVSPQERMQIALSPAGKFG